MLLTWLWRLFKMLSGVAAARFSSAPATGLAAAARLRAKKPTRYVETLENNIVDVGKSSEAK